MCGKDPDWKDEHIRALKQSLEFFSNREKLNREKWVVRRLLHALKVEFYEEEMTGADEPVDVSFRDARFQVKEIFDEGRRRTDEFKNKLEIVESANDYRELLEHYDPIDISFTEVVRLSYARAQDLLLSKYGPRESMGIDLLCYFNWIDHHVVRPVDVIIEEIGFRSLSVVSNNYCAIAYASASAPAFIRDNVGRAISYLEL